MEVIQEMSRILSTVHTGIVYIVFACAGGCDRWRILGRGCLRPHCVVLECRTVFKCVGCGFGGCLICVRVCVSVLCTYVCGSLLRVCLVAAGIQRRRSPEIIFYQLNNYYIYIIDSLYE